MNHLAIVMHFIKYILLLPIKSQIDQTSFITLAPNPAEDILTIKNIQQGSSYEIFNSTGQKSKEGFINRIDSEIELGLLPSGYYIIKIQQDNKVETLPFVKQ